MQQASAAPDGHAGQPALQGGTPMSPPTAGTAAGGAATNGILPPPAASAAPSAAHQAGNAAAIAALQVRPAASPAPAASAASPASAAMPPPGYGFTQLQLNVLRNQIMAFRRIKSNKEVEPDILSGISSAGGGQPITQPLPVAMPAQLRPPTSVPSPLQQQPGQARPVMQTAPRPVASAPMSVAQLAAQAQLQAQRLQQQQQQQAAAAAARVRDEAMRQQPALHRPTTNALFTTGAARAPMPPVPLRPGAPVMQPQQPQHVLNFDVAALMAAEHARTLRNARAARQAQLESELAAIRHDPQGAERRLKLQIELRGLRLIEVQAAMRAKVEAKQAEIMRLNDRTYRKFLRINLRQRVDMLKQEEKARAAKGSERAAAVKAFRSEMSERAGAAREARAAAVRGIEKAHARLAREANKAADDMRARRMEALKAHDFEAYQELLREPGAGGGLPAGAEERYEAVSKFLADTEDYIHKLAGKVATVKVGQEASEAAAAATLEARARGASEDEVKATAAAAAAEAAAASELVSRSKHHVGDAQSRYYSLAHSVGEVITEAPRQLKPPPGAKLREYQMVGLQWMVSLYNNHLNGILADEMGLGKTVQVMALIAHLMEKKGNYGPHLIIVPNAVMVNWKSELGRWLPGVRCVYYVGTREARARLFAAEVAALQFNVLVTTYEYIMRDRARLSKVEWKYIIIDEAQRMKDRESKLAKDLDRFVAARRLLLTGTPLQNDLRELWSLLNLLLPSVFDDKSMFHDWFGEALGAGSDAKQAGGGEEWLATEKRVVVIHRLHQILEPFMLRRQVQDVESRLPEKVAVVVKCAMTPYQAAIYNWVKMTGTLRCDPAAPMPGKNRRPYVPLNNKCMELRKVCNHPMLSYPAAPGPPLDAASIAVECGKLVVLDRLLVKLKAAGHRVLLFSTMTRLLDLLQAYLAARKLPDGTTMAALRIDGSTSLEDRETAIQQFNAPDSNAFIFLLSIRAAGRGLNLQSADTVVIYDPDPNPKNEEQAIARSHRIGQTRQVRVIHLEAVADVDAFGVVNEAAAPTPIAEQVQAAASLPLAAAGRTGAAGNNATPAAQNGFGGRLLLYADSIESLVRNKIQKMKIDMANEVIDAGRFDMQTSMAERKETLEQLLQDEDRSKQALNEVPDNARLNEMIARSPEEVAQFAAMDAQADLWLPAPEPPAALPHWLRFEADDVREAVTATSKLRPDQVTELAALAGQPGLFGEPPKKGASKRPPKARHGLGGPGQPAQALGKRRTRPNVNYANGGDLDFLLSDDDEDTQGAAVDDADMEEEVVDGNIREDSSLQGDSSSRGTSIKREPSHSSLWPGNSGGGLNPSALNSVKQEAAVMGYSAAGHPAAGTQQFMPGVKQQRDASFAKGPVDAGQWGSADGQPPAKKKKGLIVKFGKGPDS